MDEILYKYRDIDILRYFDALIVDNFSENNQNSKKDKDGGKMYTLYAATQSNLILNDTVQQRAPL